MKKWLKVSLISLGSLILLIVGAVWVVLWIVFTPEKVTPIIRDQAKNFITCRAEIGSVELTFFSTFPEFGLKIDSLTLLNPIPGAPCDTLFSANKVTCTVDMEALRKNSELILSNIHLSDGKLCAYVDSLGKTNFDIFPLDTVTVATPDTSEYTLSRIHVDALRLTNMNLRYVDEQSNIKASVTDLSAKIKGTMKEDILSAYVKADPFNVSLEYEGEPYLNHTPLEIQLLSDISLSQQLVNVQELSVSVAGMTFQLSGSVENDTLTNRILTDLSYKLEQWSLKTMVSLVPPSFSSYLEGMEIDGKLSSEGTIKGVYNDSVMPWMDIHLALEDGTLHYTDLPFPLKKITTDIHIHTDLKDDLHSSVRVNNFSANTPKSSVKIAGQVDRLFSDIHTDLTTDVKLALAEFVPMLPPDLKTTLKGAVSGRIKSKVTMQQVENMEIEKMKVSGSLTLTNLDVAYDTLLLQTNRSRIDFALPNPKASGEKHTNFIAAVLTSDNLQAKVPNNFDALLRGTQISLEVSDVRDTTQIPSVVCDFQFDQLIAHMDTMSITAVTPSGHISIEPQRKRTERQRINMTYNSGVLRANMGQDSVTVDKVAMKVGSVYDSTQQDVFLQWMPRGFVDIEGLKAKVSALSYPVEVPAVKMEFTPREFNIEKAEIKIDKSDFGLSGKLSNILPYYRGDSILRGEFNFISTNTDISQLMGMTNGLGYSENEEDSTLVAENGTGSTGPYMVPAGIDLLLHTNIKRATMDSNIMTDFKGDVRVSNGLLVLDDLIFSIPGVDMQLTAMYRTPRKNHLYVGLDFHMLDVEIEKMLEIIPDLDSIMPMLRSFKGKGEFHIAAETYLDSLYKVKMSTLRGASSIRGENLVLMDGETFGEIAKTLRFSKRAENKVDSFSAEFTIFRNEIDIYPFLIVMDKYKAVIGGRHNLDMSFNYNITIVNSPLPFRLAVDATGTMEDLKIRLAKSKYPEFYRPVSRKEVDKKRLELRAIIRNSLTEKVVQRE